MNKKEGEYFNRGFKAGYTRGRKEIQEELIELLGLWDRFEPKKEEE